MPEGSGVFFFKAGLAEAAQVKPPPAIRCPYVLRGGGAALDGAFHGLAAGRGVIASKQEGRSGVTSWRGGWWRARRQLIRRFPRSEDGAPSPPPSLRWQRLNSRTHLVEAVEAEGPTTQAKAGRRFCGEGEGREGGRGREQEDLRLVKLGRAFDSKPTKLNLSLSARRPFAE